MKVSLPIATGNCAFFFKESRWGLGGFAPDKRGVGDAPPLAVGTQTLCLPCRSGMPRTAGKHLATASAGVLLRYLSLIKQRTADDFHTVALLTFAYKHRIFAKAHHRVICIENRQTISDIGCRHCRPMQALFVIGNVSRRLSEELPLVYFFLYIGVPPFSKNTDRGIMKKA